MRDARPLTGRKVLVIALLGFGTVIGANLAMLFAATGTFPGLVVENSYVASQKWQAETDAQKALGWTVGIDYAGGRLTVAPIGPDGGLVRGLDLAATVGRPTTGADDLTLVLSDEPDGYGAPIELTPGAWRVEIRTRSGAAFRIGTTLVVEEHG